jgi:hypothetical protein
MMSKSLIGSTLIACCIINTPLHAAKDGSKGPADEAYDRANENASFQSGNPGKGKGNQNYKNLDIKDKDKESKDKKDKNNDPQLEKSLKKETTKAIKKATQ